MGIDIDVLEAQFAHAKRGDVQKAYDRTTFDEDRCRVMQEWADYIDRLCDLKAWFSAAFGLVVAAWSVPSFLRSSTTGPPLLSSPLD
ncbi:hypothetical protein [Paraburkholderia sp. 40]|uniref:hypothetical protein n=1 Tax=unclassified Paraburkholderia TaxID=2615204 RepID=UPI003D1DCBB0